jgi:hypothetical protein
MTRMRASALLTLVCTLFAVVLSVPACGGDEEPKEETGGRSIECGGQICRSVEIQGYPPIEACCAAGDVCGLDGEPFREYGAVFEEACQPRNQPGQLDDECPSSTPVPTDLGALEFPGCCKPDGVCGYLVNSAFTFINLGLGCVDATPFLDAGTPASCTPGGGGGGGAGGAGQ